MDGKLYASGSSVLKVAELAKTALNEHEARLDSLDSVEPDEIVLKTPITSVPSNVHTRLTLQEVQGNTVQNIFDEPKFNPWVAAENNKQKVFYLSRNGGNTTKLVKYGTTYTVSLTISNFVAGATIKEGTISFALTSAYDDFSLVGITGNGVYTEVFTTRTPTQEELSAGENQTVRMPNSLAIDGMNFTISNLMILEGDWTNRTDIPDYFTGIQSADSVQVKAVGKNLFDINNIDIIGKSLYNNVTPKKYHDGTVYPDNLDYKISNNTLTYSLLDYGWYGFTYKIPVKPNTNYTLSYDVESVENFRMTLYECVDDTLTKLIINQSFTTKPNNLHVKFTTSNCNDIVIYIGANKADTTKILKIFNIQLEEGTTATEYEPYQSTTFQIPLEEPLRSLPNGVCDYIKDGKIVRNVGKINALDLPINAGTLLEDTVYRYSLVFESNTADGGSAGRTMCNSLAYKWDYSNASEHYYMDTIRVWVFLSKDKVDGTPSSLSNYMKQNPIILYYVLSTPIIEDLPIPNDGILRSYENGHLLLENTPVRPVVTFNYKSGLKGAINDMQVDIENHEVQLRSLQVTETGEQVLTERVNDLVMQDGNVKVEEIKGNTVQNIIMGYFNDPTYGYSKGYVVDENDYVTFKDTSYDVIIKKGGLLLKPNTQYTVVLDIKENTSEFPLSINGLNSRLCATGDVWGIVDPKRTGIYTRVVTTKTAFDDTHLYDLWIYHHGAGNGIETNYIKFRAMVLEGDWTGKKIPSYFTGIKSVNEEQTGLTVRSIGKNILNVELGLNDILTKTNDGGYQVKNRMHQNGYILRFSRAIPFKIKKGTKIVTSVGEFNNQNAPNTPRIPLLFRDASGASYYTSADPKYKTDHEAQSDYVSVELYIQGNDVEGAYYTFKDLQLEIGDIATECEPYKESVITIPYTEPLRKLPNGVCDTVEDGKVIRRIRKYTFTGNEDWGMNSTIVEGYNTWHISHAYLKHLSGYDIKANKIVLSDKLLGDLPWNHSEGSFMQRPQFSDATEVLTIRLPDTIEHTNTGIKEWLSTNTPTLYFELATPIIEEIPEITLHGYKHLIFDNDIIPSEATISFAESNYSRLVALEETNVRQSKEIADLCAMVDALTLQIGNLL